MASRRKDKNTVNIVDPSNMRIYPINVLRLWKDNPRKNDKAVLKLTELIKLHGQRTPVVAWSKNNVVYKGNTTLKAMKKLGMKQIAVIFHDFKSEAEAIAYGMSDNKASEWSDWDDSVLVRLMQSEEIAPMITPEMTGFSEKTLKGLSLSTELPDQLPDVDLSGVIDGRSDFMVLTFKSKEEMEKFRSVMGNKVVDSRGVPFEALKPYLSDKFKEEMNNGTSSEKSAVRRRKKG